MPTERAQVTVEAWAASEQAAHDLSQTVRAVLHAARGDIEGVRIYRVEEVAGPGYLPDPLSDQPRYSFTALITARGAAETGS